MNTTSNAVPPIWWQNSKVSYSFFASGASSFLDFSMAQNNQGQVNQQVIQRTSSHGDNKPINNQKSGIVGSYLTINKTSSNVNLKARSSDMSIGKNSNQKVYLEEVSQIVNQKALFDAVPNTQHSIGQLANVNTN